MKVDEGPCGRSTNNRWKFSNTNSVFNLSPCSEKYPHERLSRIMGRPCIPGELVLPSDTNVKHHETCFSVPLQCGA